jgi:hypothetical protein
MMGNQVSAHVRFWPGAAAVLVEQLGLMRTSDSDPEQTFGWAGKPGPVVTSGLAPYRNRPDSC